MHNKELILLISLCISAFFIAGCNSNNDGEHMRESNVNNQNYLNCFSGAEINWININSDSDFQSCLLMLARKLENWENMSDWLINQGFSDVTKISNTPNRIYLNAIWDIEKTGSRIPFAINLSFFQHRITSGKNYKVQVIYDRLIPISVNAHHIIK